MTDTLTNETSAPDQTRRNSLVINLLLISTFVVMLNENLMSVALVDLMRELHITATTGQWLTTGFLLTMAIVIPITGFLLRRFSTRTLFITAMGLFTLGTAVAAVAPGFSVLLTGRIVQASGTAIMLPLLMTTVMTLEPPATRGRRMGLIAIVMAVAPAIGPTISGLVLASLSWRALFFIMLPIAVAALALGIARVQNVTETARTPIDVVSVVFSAVGFGGVVYGLSSIGEGGASAAWTPAIAISVGAFGLGAFVWRQLLLQRRDVALLDLRTFQTPSFTISIALLMLSMLALFGTLILLPIYMQSVLGLSVLASGLALLPGGAVMAVLAQPVGRLYDRVGARVLLVPGLAVVGGTLWTLTQVLTAATPLLVVVVAYTVLSIGLAFVFTPLFTATLSGLAPRLYSYGSATMSSLQQVAAAAGTAVFVSTMTAQSGGSTAPVQLASGITGALTIGAVAATAAAVLALVLRVGPGTQH